MREPLFKKYCESSYCRAKQIHLRQKGDGYWQVCPVCGWTWNPTHGMTGPEINQWEMGEGDNE